MENEILYKSTIPTVSTFLLLQDFDPVLTAPWIYPMERFVSKFFINFFLTESKEEHNLEKNSLLCLEGFMKPQLPKPNDYMMHTKVRQKIRFKKIEQKVKTDH